MTYTKGVSISVTEKMRALNLDDKVDFKTSRLSNHGDRWQHCVSTRSFNASFTIGVYHVTYVNYFYVSILFLGFCVNKNVHD